MCRQSRFFAGVFSAAVLVAVASSAYAVNPDEVLSDPKLEQRARALSAELRCMVCQNQSIDNSDAELAKDLRILVRERLSAGDTDKEVLDFLVSRYGEFVLLKPGFAFHTFFLWAAPILVLLIGGVVLALSRRRAINGAASLSEDEASALAKILNERDD